ncbi:MAG: hypothetical protein Q8O56_03920 [Solirubrobacteraceae bacterium]|nr:hypothetical protein [Solirubrobacteraceae bacterium]
MGDELPTTYEHYADFLAGDSRREGDALELGANWSDGGKFYRACWYAETGELTFERISAAEPLDLEDFHHGIAGPVEIVTRVPDRRTLDALVGRWPDIAAGLPRRLEALRQLIASHG